MDKRLAEDVNASGLLYGFRLLPLAACGAEMLAQPAPETAHWLHFNLIDSRARHFLNTAADLPEIARDLLLDAEPRIQLQKLPESFVAVLGDLHHDFDTDPEGLGVLRVYVDKKRVISLRGHPLRTPDILRRELAQNVELDDGSSLGLFQRLLETLAATFSTVVEDLSDRVDTAEDRILAGAYSAQGATLGSIRRLLARLRRHINANRSALGSLPDRLGDWCDAEQRRGLREAVTHLDNVAQDLELCQERARLLQEEIAGRVGEATNKNLFVLSIVTTTLLPITLITGIFGMNVGGLPWLNHPNGFLHVMIFMCVCVIFALVLLKRQRLFNR